MTNFYLDTSALVKLYVYESGTSQMLELASKADNQLTLSTLTQIEFHSAVRSRQRAGDMDDSVSESMLDRFDNDLDNRFNRQAVNGYVIDLAAGLVEQYPLRAYDALQLAACLIFRTAAPEEPVFVCADKELLAAAESEGLTTIDPSSQAEPE